MYLLSSVSYLVMSSPMPSPVFYTHSTCKSPEFVETYCKFGNNEDEAIRAYLSQLRIHIAKLINLHRIKNWEGLRAESYKMNLLCRFSFVKELNEWVSRLGRLCGFPSQSNELLDHCIEMIIRRFKMLEIIYID